MEHIRQFDWCMSQRDFQFITEDEVDNCVTERILRNKFHDPLVSSDSENDTHHNRFDWDQIFKRNHFEQRQLRLYVAGIRPIAQHLKLSALSTHQHYQCLKVLCSQNPHVLDEQFIPRPTKQDHRVFRELKEIYEKEQKEYIEWAKTQWTNNHCSRALRPKPPIEMVYEAEFKLKVHELQSLPKDYEMVAQIPLEGSQHKCNLVFNKDLKSVNISELPLLEYSEVLHKKTTVLRPYPVPEPCNKHPCRFVLPNEESQTMLPLREVYLSLAQWAAASGTPLVASEPALCCLLGSGRWRIPISVCSAIGQDGENCNVIILDSEFTLVREAAQTRTYKALRHLLENTLLPMKNNNVNKNDLNKTKNPSNDNNKSRKSSLMASLFDVDSSSDDDDVLFIDEPVNNPQSNYTSGSDTEMLVKQKSNNVKKKPSNETHCKKNKERNDKVDSVGFYNCTCKDTDFARISPRSFRKWQIKNGNTRETVDFIIHCTHRVRDETGEVVLEPIPEYQIELGGSSQSQDKIRNLALSLLLRRNASLLNVRIDAPTGEIVTIDNVTLDQLTTGNDVLSEAANRIYTVLNQLQGLMPGYYILEHEPVHGLNALLYKSSSCGPPPAGVQALQLQFGGATAAEADESAALRLAPTLAPVLLPYHKFRRILPCAFTHNPDQLSREPRRPPARQRTPPQAIKLDEKEQRRAGQKWPKRRSKKRKN
ncbi:uncharacterized protein LOC131854048 isoform X2 [Achroia grisella]|uniref:uncharacterized protein LOC131854048 isoform X2 n=1 Tax=Achroia grisella TaxID=688607 RepID=UPI0027D20B5E|nr:uncharacterized protein LOC131854048 isoform X2 [Achroia grisella]